MGSCTVCGTVTSGCSASTAISFTGGATGATGAPGIDGQNGADGIAGLHNDLTAATQTGNTAALLTTAYTLTVEDNFDTVGDKIKLIANLELSTDYAGDIYFTVAGASVGYEYTKVAGSGAEYLKLELILNCKATAPGSNVLVDYAADIAAVGAGGVSTRVIDPYSLISMDLSGTTTEFALGIYTDQSAGTSTLRQFSVERMKIVE